MSEEYSDPTAESEMRRRAAWLLAMLVIVAVLVVALMVFFLKGGGSSQAGPTGPALPTGPLGGTGSSSPVTGGSTAATSGSNTASSSPGVHQPPRSHRHHVSCASDLPCVAPGDIGNAVAAINSYRRQHGQSPVDGRVSDAAQQCALTNGDDCNGEWAESQVPDADGKDALRQVLPFAKAILDPGLKSLEVGWAWDPAAQQYYFAIIQNT